MRLVAYLTLGFLLVGAFVINDRAPAKPALDVVEQKTVSREAREWPPRSQTTTTLPPTTTTTFRHVRKLPSPTTTVAPRNLESATANPSFSGSIPDLIRQGFARFGPVVAEQAVRVASCETGGTFNPNMTGSQGEVGVLQIHPKYHSGRAAKFGWTMADLYDPAKNVVVAADLYEEAGSWQPWTCRTAT